MKKISWLICFLSAFSAQALDTLEVSHKLIDYELSEIYFEIIEDNSGLLDERSILSEASQKRFKVDKHKSQLSSKLNTPYWGRFSVKATNASLWLLEFGDPHIEHIDFYEYKDGKLISVSPHKGFSLPFSTKDFNHKNFVFNLPLFDQKPHLYYIKFKSSIYNSFFGKIRSPEFIFPYSLTEYFILGLYYGILLIIALYTLFIYFSVREKTYIYYVLFVVFCGLNSMNEDGLGFQFLWPNFPIVNLFLLRTVPYLLLLSFSIYSLQFLKLKYHSPFLTKSILIMLGLNGVLFLVSYLAFHYSQDFQLFYFFSYALLYIGGIYMISKGYKPARYYLLGYSFILVGFIIFYLRLFEIEILNHFLTVYSFNIGFLLEIIILSFALSERLKEEKIEKENAQRHIIDQLQKQEVVKDEMNKELELKVSQRTSELSSANEEINRINKILNISNQKLQEDVKHIAKDRIMQKEVSLEEFKKIYPDETACYHFLADLKWSEGYRCKKCKNDKYAEVQNLSRRCNKCKYTESPTAFTLFHSIKFSILEAFYLLFLVNNRKEISSEELSNQIHLSEKSCTAFKRKILLADKSIKVKSKDKSGWERLIPFYEEE